VSRGRRLVRWWWGDPTSLGVIGRVLILAGMTIEVLMDGGGLRPLGLVIWVLGLVLVFADNRRRPGA
jgi:hypothetical protein